MQTPGSKSDTGKPRRFNWRPALRAFHRDLGYVAVGLTFVYALSGLAVNHVLDWDPSFVEYRTTRPFTATLPQDDRLASLLVLQTLGVDGPVRESYRYPTGELYLKLDERTLHVDPARKRVIDEGQRPRFLLRLVNWLHLNRGKRAWTVVADIYAIGLLTLACTGLFMLPGRKGLMGRGWVLVALGIAIPVLYVSLSGGPAGSGTRPPPPTTASPGNPQDQ